MNQRTCLLAIALATTGCVKTQRTTAWDATPAKRTSVKGAVRLPDGDLQLEKLRRRVLENPMDNAARLELARYYDANGQKDFALEHYRIMGARHPEDELFARLQAQAARATDPAGALLVLREFAARYPVEQADTYSMLAILEDETGALAAGEELHRKALELDPKSDRLHNNLGFNLARQGKHGEAVEEFRRALVLNKKSPVARNNLAASLARQDGKQDEAFRIWKRALGPAEAHNNVGASLLERGQAAAARKEFQQAVGIKPGLVEAWHNLRLADAEEAGLRHMVAPLTSVPETGQFSHRAVLQRSNPQVAARGRKPAEISSILWTDKGVPLP